MPLVCHNGQVAISDMMNLSNQNETDVAANAANIALNLTSLIAHGTEIIKLDNRLDLIEGGPSAAGLASAVAALEADRDNMQLGFANLLADYNITDASLIAAIADIVDANADIATNQNDIVDIQADILLLSSGVTGLTNADALTVTSATNKLITQADFLNQVLPLVDDIVDPVTNKLVTESGLKRAIKNFSIIKHKTAIGADGGSSVAGSWTLREMNDITINHLGAILSGNKIQLPAGDYVVDGFAIGTGAYHQSRIYDETNSLVLALGTSQKDGASFISEGFTLTGITTIKLETQVDVSVTGVGFGEANPFDEGIFSTLKITKTGE